MNSLEYWLWLSALEISAVARAALLERFGTPKAVYNASEMMLTGIRGLSGREAALVAANRDEERVRTIRRACDAEQIDILTAGDARYPERLQNIYAPPAVLYVRGRLPFIDEEAAIAVIGTRKASEQGIRIGRQLAGEISACGGLVISGLTAGVDAAAAEGVLAMDGICVGVLGTPHGKSAVKLADEVSRRGAVLSEYPPEMPQQRSFYRERNRIAAGLSVGTVVVEAPEKSGTRLFAREAVEQGKDIFAVPGFAEAPLSAGPNRLIEEGARPITSGWEIMSEYTHLFPDKVHPAAAEEERDANEKEIDKENSKEYIDFRKRLESLSAEQLSVIAAIEREGSYVDEIIEASGLPAGKVLAQLTVLEIRGFVRRDAGKRYFLAIF